MTETFDDRLLGHDDVESLMDAAEEVAADLGSDHAPETHCHHCVQGTPLGMDTARDVPKAKKMDKLESEVHERVTDLTGNESAWVMNDLYRAYREAFNDELADVKECEMRNEPGHAEEDF